MKKNSLFTIKPDIQYPAKLLAKSVSGTTLILTPHPRLRRSGTVFYALNFICFNFTTSLTWNWFCNVSSNGSEEI